LLQWWCSGGGNGGRVQWGRSE